MYASYVEGHWFYTRQGQLHFALILLELSKPWFRRVHGSCCLNNKLYGSGTLQARTQDLVAGFKRSAWLG